MPLFWISSIVFFIFCWIGGVGGHRYVDLANIGTGVDVGLSHGGRDGGSFVNKHETILAIISSLEPSLY